MVSVSLPCDQLHLFLCLTCRSVMWDKWAVYRKFINSIGSMIYFSFANSIYKSQIKTMLFDAKSFSYTPTECYAVFFSCYAVPTQYHTSTNYTHIQFKQWTYKFFYRKFVTNRNKIALSLLVFVRSLWWLIHIDFLGERCKITHP